MPSAGSGAHCLVHLLAPTSRWVVRVTGQAALGARRAQHSLLGSSRGSLPACSTPRADSQGPMGVWCVCHSRGPRSSHPETGEDHDVAVGLMVEALPPKLLLPWRNEKGGPRVAAILGAEGHTLSQMRRPLDLPLQPLVRPGSPRHQQPVLPPPQPEEKGTETQLAAPFLEEKPSSRLLEASPQHPTVHRPPPAADPPPKTHVGNSVLHCVQFSQQMRGGDPLCLVLSQGAGHGPPLPPTSGGRAETLRLDASRQRPPSLRFPLATVHRRLLRGRFLE